MCFNAFSTRFIDDLSIKIKKIKQQQINVSIIVWSFRQQSFTKCDNGWNAMQKLMHLYVQSPIAKNCDIDTLRTCLVTSKEERPEFPFKHFVTSSVCLSRNSKVQKQLLSCLPLSSLPLSSRKRIYVFSCFFIFSNCSGPFFTFWLWLSSPWLSLAISLLHTSVA